MKITFDDDREDIIIGEKKEIKKDVKKFKTKEPKKGKKSSKK